MDSSIHMHNFIWFLLVGGLAGWLASSLVEGAGLGIVGDIVVGVLGAFLGGFLADEFGLYVYGFWGVLGVSVLGAVILLSLIRLFNRRKPVRS